MMFIWKASSAGARNGEATITEGKFLGGGCLESLFKQWLSDQRGSRAPSRSPRSGEGNDAHWQHQGSGSRSGQVMGTRTVSLRTSRFPGLVHVRCAGRKKKAES